MHSCETVPAPPATGPSLLQQLGRLIIRARSRSPARTPRAPADPRLLKAKLLAAKSQPSTSQQVVTQPRSDAEPRPAVEAQLDTHVQALWNEQIPICIEVLLAPDCPECYAKLSKVEGEGTFDKSPNQERRGLLLERWTMSVVMKKSHETQASITSQWLLSAVRSQLHFSQLSAWLARLKTKPEAKKTVEDSQERRMEPVCDMTQQVPDVFPSMDCEIQDTQVSLMIITYQRDGWRKLSRETCNFKKLEANCDEKDLPKSSTDDQTASNQNQRKLNVVYSIKIPGESYKMADFSRQPTDHTFPITDIGSNVHLKVLLESLPRIEDIPAVRCTCNQTPPKRRASKEMPNNIHEEITSRMNDLTLGPPDKDYRSHFNDLGVINSNIGCSSGVSRRLSIFSNSGSNEYIFRAGTPDKTDKNDDIDGNNDKEGVVLVDDRMHTPCSENGKHKCNCDDESDQGKENQKSSTNINQETKKLDERRLKEIAKYKRRLRKESKLKKIRDSNSESTGTSEGDGLNAKSKKDETHTSIPILQAARFDRFRAIGCYRNQTYLTLPASRMESKSPFLIENINVPATEYKKTNTVSTQTDELICDCGSQFVMKCENCNRGMVRSEANYDLTAIDDKAKRRSNNANVQKKHKCDNFSNNIKCDINSVVDSVKEVVSGIRKCPDDDEQTNNNIIKRPKLKRFFPIVDRIEKLVTDRFSQKEKDVHENSDIEELLLKDDDSVFANMSRKKQNPDETPKVKPVDKRQKYSSISEDYVLYEKCYYGTFDKFEVESPKEPSITQNGFEFPDPNNSQGKQDSQVPSPTEMDRFRWRFDSAASMVFHTKTGLPLTSSPAPLKRGNNCFDYDDSINGISGIKSALFHPVSPASPCVSPASPRPALPPLTPPETPLLPKLTKPRLGPSAGLLGSFEESALKGRLEPVATVHGFTAELGASGAFCPPHRRLPVTVFFYAPGGTNAPYMGHINLGGGGYKVSRSGTVQVSLFNPHGTLVKMFVVLYDLTSMPAHARTFLRQRTLYLPAGCPEPPYRDTHKYMRYLIHLRFMTSKSGKLYLHTDIRIIVSRKADMDTATAHSAIFKPIPTNNHKATTNQEAGETNEVKNEEVSANRKPCRVFGGCSDFRDFELGYENQNGVSYELRSFTYGPENPKYSPR